jgi:hypothetical protein
MGDGGVELYPRLRNCAKSYSLGILAGKGWIAARYFVYSTNTVLNGNQIKKEPGMKEKTMNNTLQMRLWAENSGILSQSRPYLVRSSEASGLGGEMYKVAREMNQIKA